MNIIILILNLFVCLQVNAINYYVSNTGKDTNNGTEQTTAWKTIAKVNKTSFLSGDTILFKSGDTWFEQLNVPSSGIVITRYGTGIKPVIDGEGKRQYGIYISKKNHLVISDIDVKNCLYAGIRFSGGGIYDGKPGVYFQGYSIIERVTASKCLMFGFVTGNGYSNTIIRNCSAFSNGNGFYADGQANYTLFQYDTAWDNIRRLTSPTTDGDGIAVYKSSFNTIENCLSYENKTGFGIEVDLAGTDSAIVIRNNISHSNGSILEGYGISTGNLKGSVNTNVVHNNLTYFNGNDPVDKSGRELNHHNGNISFFNNTSYTSGMSTACGLTLADSGTVTFRSNYIYSYGGVGRRCIRIFGAIVLRSEQNKYYSTDPTPFSINATAYSFENWKALGLDNNSSYVVQPLNTYRCL